MFLTRQMPFYGAQAAKMLIVNTPYYFVEHVNINIYPCASFHQRGHLGFVCHPFHCKRRKQMLRWVKRFADLAEPVADIQLGIGMPAWRLLYQDSWVFFVVKAA